jgi:hypothetical protein
MSEIDPKFRNDVLAVLDERFAKLLMDKSGLLNMTSPLSFLDSKEILEGNTVLEPVIIAGIAILGTAKSNIDLGNFTNEETLNRVRKMKIICLGDKENSEYLENLNPENILTGREILMIIRMNSKITSKGIDAPENFKMSLEGFNFFPVLIEGERKWFSAFFSKTHSQWLLCSNKQNTSFVPNRTDIVFALK